MNHIATSDRALYEADEHAWMQRQIEALRDGRLEQLDRKSLVEFLTDMGLQYRRELESRLVVLVGHMLKIRYQPHKHGKSWNATVRTQQREIRTLLRSVPSVAARRDAVLADAYPDAKDLAVVETGLPAATFPPVSPWTVDAALAFTPPEPQARTQFRRKP